MLSAVDYRKYRMTNEEYKRREALALEGIKTCCKCRGEFPIGSFSLLHRTKDGRAPQCKACAAAYYQRAKELFTFASSDFSAIRAAANSRGIPFELTATGLRAFWQNTPEVCAYCAQGAEEVGRLAALIVEGQEGSRFLANLSARIRWAFKRRHPSRRLTIDRKDNEGSYTLGNIQKACFICNYLKGAVLTDEEMHYLAPRLWARIKEATA